MKTNSFGCLSLTGILVALVTILFVTGVTMAKGGALFSPGKLNAQTGSILLGGASSHAEIAHCGSCHAAPWDIQKMSDLCIECHENIMADPNDFHKVMLAEGKRGSCRECHTDHRGAEASLTIEDLSGFPHEVLGFSLKTHLQLADGSPFGCSDCHSDTYLSFEIKTCEKCHTQLEAVFIKDHLAAFSANCLMCHDGLDSYGKAFDHTKVPFALTGKHSALACQKCHQEAQTISDLRAAPSDCTTCHIQEDSHEGRFGTNCGSCHTPDGWKPAKFDHNLAYFKLTGKHIQVECENCHGDGKYAGIPQDCFTCHAQNDVHQGRLGQDCASCHTPEGWKPANFDHETAAFQLVGKHAGVMCESCHTDKLFKGTPQDCASCHLKDDAHAGQFGTDCRLCHTPAGWNQISFDHSKAAFQLTGSHIQVNCQSCHSGGKFKGTPTTCFACHNKDDNHAGQFGPDCGTCHSTQSWKGATFDHSRASFQLTGAHTQAACTQCHSGGKFKGTPTSCVACHSEPNLHKGVLGTDCGACHNTSRWSPASYSGPHSFPMSHGNPGSCSTCHPSSLGSWTCYSCHDQGEITHKHQEENIGDFSNCLKCHPAGREGDDD